MCSWSLTVQDNDGNPTTFDFDLFRDDSPLIIGLDLRRYSDTENMGSVKLIRIKRPTDGLVRTFDTYMSGTGELDKRLRIGLCAIAGVPGDKSARALMAKFRPSTLVRRFHRLTHATPAETRRFMKEGGIMSEDVWKEIERVCSACEICAKSGLPAATHKISLTHVNQHFNAEVQIDFTYIHIRGNKHVVLHIVDAGTAYSESAIVSDRRITTALKVIEEIWLNRHGAPDSISADDELDATQKKNLKTFLSSRHISFKPRPVRRHNKVGIAERKHGTLKRVLEKLQFDRTDAEDETILSRATFLSNVFAGSHMLSSFELARGFSPSMLGIPARLVTAELLSAHREQQATRALQRLMHARPIPDAPPPNLTAGNPIFFYYKSSKNNENDEWKSGRILAIERYYAVVQSDKTGRKTKVAYEDIRIKPQSELTRELMADTVEYFMGEKEDLPRRIDGGEREQPVMGPEQGHTTGTDTHMHSAIATTNASDIMTRQDHGSNIARASMDIGSHAGAVMEDDKELNVLLGSTEQSLLREIEEHIGTRQVTRRGLESVPEWLVKKAMNNEVEENWKSAIEEVGTQGMPDDANILSTHFVFNIKKSEQGHRTLKARLVVHGNRDEDKDDVRKDAMAADMMMTRLVIALGTIMRFTFGVADIKGAFMQSGPAQRDIYIIPPATYRERRRVYWKLLALAYGICDAGRQWLKTSDTWITKDLGMKRLAGAHQLFIRRDHNEKLVLIVAKTTDDFLVAGEKGAIESFFGQMRERFVVGKAIIERKMKFNGCVMDVDEDGSISLSMHEYLDRLAPIDVSRNRRKEIHSVATQREIYEYRSLAGTLMYLGTSVLPQASLATSLMQQRINCLKVSHILDANSMLRDIVNLRPTLRFPVAADGKGAAMIVSFSDAAHGGKDFDYGQTGGVTGIRIPRADGTGGVYYGIGWTSCKQKRISHSSFGAEIIAAADIDERGFDLRETVREIFPHCHIRHEMIVDSKALFDTITTLHECREYRLRRTVSRIRHSFESHELDVVRWLPGRENVADALTKRNRVLWLKLNELLSSGVWDVDMGMGKAHDGSVWV